jgi:hypothetical protein
MRDTSRRGRYVAGLTSDRDEILGMDLEDLGVAILRQVSSASGTISANNFVREYFAVLSPPPGPRGGIYVLGRRSPNQDRELAEALLEGWQWLVNEGLLALDPLERPGWYFVTRRGREALA